MSVLFRLRGALCAGVVAPEGGLRTHRRTLAAARLARFGASAGAATLLHWAVMAVLIAMNWGVVLASTTGAVAGSALNYLLQSRWTFNASQPRWVTYIFVVLIGWSANAAIVRILVAFAGFGCALGQFCATACVALLNYAFYQRLVFHERTH